MIQERKIFAYYRLQIIVIIIIIRLSRFKKKKKHEKFCKGAFFSYFTVKIEISIIKTIPYNLTITTIYYTNNNKNYDSKLVLLLELNTTSDELQR